ncbi:hypothetical protein [Nocardia sp. NPDC004260]
MPEAAIVSIARSPRRAAKGEIRPDDPAAQTGEVFISDERLGLETMCVGGGRGMAMVPERLS